MARVTINGVLSGLCWAGLVALGGCADTQYLPPFEQEESSLLGVLGHNAHKTGRQWVVSPQAVVCVYPVALGEHFPLEDGYRALHLQKQLQQALSQRFFQARLVTEDAGNVGCHYDVQSELLNLKDRPNLWREVADDPSMKFVGGDEIGFKMSLSESARGTLLDVTFVSVGNAWLVSSEDHMDTLIRKNFDLYARYLTPSHAD